MMEIDDRGTPQFQRHLKRLLKSVNSSKLKRGVALQSMRQNIVRVHEKGLDSKGKSIARGGYSRKPIYIAPERLPRKKKPRGKTKAGNFKSGKKRKTRYYKGGYRHMKKEQRDTTKVNLWLTGRLKNDYKVINVSGEVALTFGSYGREIASGLESRNKFSGQIWGVTPNEEKELHLIIDDFLDKNVKL